MDVFKAIKGRRTVRAFQSATGGTRKTDCVNRRRKTGFQRRQPAAVTLYRGVRDRSLVDQLFAITQWAGLVKPRRNPELGKTSPPLFIVVTQKTGANPQVEAGAAIQNLQLAAYALGLGLLLDRCI